MIKFLSYFRFVPYSNYLFNSYLDISYLSFEFNMRFNYKNNFNINYLKFNFMIICLDFNLIESVKIMITET